MRCLPGDAEGVLRPDLSIPSNVVCDQGSKGVQHDGSPEHLTTVAGCVTTATSAAQVFSLLIWLEVRNIALRHGDQVFKVLHALREDEVMRPVQSRHDAARSGCRASR